VEAEQLGELPRLVVALDHRLVSLVDLEGKLMNSSKPDSIAKVLTSPQMQ